MRVTEILKLTGFCPRPQGISDEMARFYMDRGTQVHAATALLDNTGKLPIVDTVIFPYLVAWSRFKKESNVIVREVEKEVQSVKMGYAGRLDRVIGPNGLTPHRPAVLDIKTTSFDPSVRLQLMAYKLAYQEMTGVRSLARIAVALKQDETYSVEVYDQEDDNADQAAWQACLTIMNWRGRREF